MALGETAQLVVEMRYISNLAAGTVKDEAALKSLNATTMASKGHLTGLVGAAGTAEKGVSKFGGALGHAKSQIGNLISGPLGIIGLGAGLFSLGGAIDSSVHKISDFGLSLEKVQGLTGETALQSGTLILLFEKFGLGIDRVGQIAGFAEKTLGKLNDTTAKGAKATKSAALTQLEYEKTLREAHGQSTTAINKLISEQKARDQLNVKAAGSLSKLQALDKQYGLSLVDNKGKVVDFSTELSQLATFYDSSASASTKAYVASLVLGRGYAAMIPILKGGSAAIRDAAAEAASLGLGSSDTVAKLALFRESMRNLGAAVNILQLQIGLALVPALTDAVKTMTTWLSSGGSAQIVGFFKSAAQFARDFGAVVEHSVIPVFQGIAAAWAKVPGPLKDLLIGGFVANKASKFLFNFGIGDLLKGVGGMGGVLGRGSSAANPVWVASEGLGGVGGKGGLLNVAVMAISAIALAAMADDIQRALGSNYNPANNLPLDQLSWPFGPKNTPNVDLGPWKNILGGDSTFQGAGKAADDAVVPRLTGFAQALKTATLITRAFYDALNAEIGHHGAKFLAAGDKGGTKTRDESAAKLVDLYRLSQAPSLHSMETNLGHLLDEAKRHPTDKGVQSAIIGLRALIEGVTAAINNKTFFIGKAKDDLVVPRPKTPGPRNLPPGHHAGGGMFGAGDWSWVGESGPELVRFGRPGRVIPNRVATAGTTINVIAGTPYRDNQRGGAIHDRYTRVYTGNIG